MADWLRRLRRLSQGGAVQFGSLRRVTPVSRLFGFDRGQPVDRYYIERFLSQHARDIHGSALEVGDDRYLEKFGGHRVTSRHVLHVEAGHPGVTMVADLARMDLAPADAFDCIIATQTLQFIYDVRTAAGNLHRMLKPGGVVLATVPGISQISRFDMDRWGEYWRFTTLSVKRLFGEAAPWAAVSIDAHGNVLSAVALLHGLAAQELTRDELDFRDDDYELVMTIRAVKR